MPERVCRSMYAGACMPEHVYWRVCWSVSTEACVPERVCRGMYACLAVRLSQSSTSFESSYSSPLRSVCACLTGGFRALDFFECSYSSPLRSFCACLTGGFRVVSKSSGEVRPSAFVRSVVSAVVVQC
jgi:hypothetical protein